MIAFPSRERRVKARRRPEGAELRELNSGVNQAGGGAARWKDAAAQGQGPGTGWAPGEGLATGLGGELGVCSWPEGLGLGEGRG